MEDSTKARVPGKRHRIQDEAPYGLMPTSDTLTQVKVIK